MRRDNPTRLMTGSQTVWYLNTKSGRSAQVLERLVRVFGYDAIKDRTGLLTLDENNAIALTTQAREIFKARTENFNFLLRMYQGVEGWKIIIDLDTEPQHGVIHRHTLTDFYKRLTSWDEAQPLDIHTPYEIRDMAQAPTPYTAKSKMTKIEKIAALVNPETTTIGCLMDGKVYVYRVTKDVADEIERVLEIFNKESEEMGMKRDAFVNVLCESSDGSSTYFRRMCVEVHAEPMIDPDSDIHYLWAIGLEKTETRAAAEAMDKKLAETLAQKQRQSYRQTVLAQYGIEKVEDLLIEKK